MELKNIPSILKNKKSASNIKQCFIYFLIKNDKIVYVGQTTNGLTRIGQHAYTKDFDYYSIVECNEEDLNDTEASYIVSFNPYYNGAILPLNNLYKTKKQLKQMFEISGQTFNKIASKSKLNIYFNSYYSYDEFAEAYKNIQL